MKKLLAALLLVAAPAFGQNVETRRVSAETRRVDGSSTVATYAGLPAPSGCVATSVPIFLGSPVVLGCDPGLTYDAGTGALAVPGALTVGGPLVTGQSQAATLGAEILLNPSFASDLSQWTVGAGWSWATGGALHTAGATATLAQAFPTSADGVYNLSVSISGRTTGSVKIVVGTATVYVGSSAITQTALDIPLYMYAGSTLGIVLTPTTDFNGTITDASVKALTPSTIAISVGPLVDPDPQLRVKVFPGAASMFIGGWSGDAFRAGAYSMDTMVGFFAGWAMTTATANTGVGAYALGGATSGAGNTAVGSQSLGALRVGTANTAVGAGALGGAFYGNHNVAVGFDAGANSTASTGTFVGALAGKTSGATPATGNAAVTGAGLTFIGYRSGLGSATQRTNSTAIGFESYVDADNTVVLGDENVTEVKMGSAGQAKISGANVYEAPANFSIALGSTALRRASPGAGNVAVGDHSLMNMTGGNYNVALGSEAARMKVTGDFNVAIGYNAAWDDRASTYNVAIGNQALYGAGAATYSYNVAVGDLAGYSMATGTRNVLLGRDAGRYVADGYDNIALGYRSLSNADVSGLIGIGRDTLWSSDSTTLRATAVGHYALSGTGASSADSTALGYEALSSNTSGSGNTALGSSAGYTTGATPVTGNAVTTGSNNTFVGFQAGLGSSSQRTNTTAVGAGAYVDASDTVVLGDENVTDVLAGSAGQAKVTAKGIKLTTGTRPTCDAAARGTMWYVAGAAGAADTIEMCGKAAADTYSWVALAAF